MIFSTSCKGGWRDSLVKLSLPTHNIDFDKILQLGSMTKLQCLWWYGKHRWTFEGSWFNANEQIEKVYCCNSKIIIF